MVEAAAAQVDGISPGGEALEDYTTNEEFF